MHRLVVAIQALFLVLFNRKVFEGVDRVLKERKAPQLPAETPPKVETTPVKAPKPVKAPPKRNDALNLLAALQREGRLVDFLQESLEGLSDAQIGAAVRDVHRNCHTVVERMFALQPVETAAEGSQIEAPVGFDPAKIRLVGNVAGQPPFRGTLCHHGWQATRCELPEWSGSEQSLLVVAPAELEVK